MTRLISPPKGREAMHGVRDLFLVYRFPPVLWTSPSICPSKSTRDARFSRPSEKLWTTRALRSCIVFSSSPRGMG